MLTLLIQVVGISNEFNAMYVNTVNKKHIHTFLPVTFLIFNRFSVRKKFWKAETQSFSTLPLNVMYVDTVNTGHKYFLCIQCYVYQSSRYILYTIYTHVMVCMLMQSIQSNYNVDPDTKSLNYMKI